MAKALQQHNIASDDVSLLVHDLQTDASLLHFNADTPRNPASAMKLLTAAAALDLLGPTHAWQTDYLAAAPLRDGVLHGDLILRGGGDPFYTVEYVLADILALRGRGVREVRGRLVIDNARFAPAKHDRAAFDGKPRRLYNVGPDAALMNFSASWFVLTADGDKVRVRVDPPLAGLTIVNQLRARGGRCNNPAAGWSYDLTRDGDDPRLTFRGDYRAACGERRIGGRALLPNAEYAYRLFAALWREMGGGALGGFRIGKTPDDARLLHRRESRPLADIITGMNKFSNNVMARQLLLSLGARDDAPGNEQNGIQAVRDWLARVGVAMPGLVLENGAGLSRKSRMSAAGMTDLLRYVWASAYRPEFLSSLPLAALDGTMRRRLRDTPLRGRARIKTGLLDGVRAMAGYVHARDGGHYAVTLFIASPAVNFWRGNAVQDAVLQWVYSAGSSH